MTGFFSFFRENYFVRLFIDLSGQKMVGVDSLNSLALSEQIAVSCSDQAGLFFARSPWVSMVTWFLT